MKLYYSKGACSLAVRITLHELNIPCEYESVDLKTKKTGAGKDYLTINPKGAVPALQLEDNSILTENCIIQQFLADKFSAHQLLPAMGNLQRYRILEWLNFVSTDLHKGCSPLFNPILPADIKEKFFIPALLNKLIIVDQHLQKNNFLMGNDFTLPDGYLFVVLRWLPYLKVDISHLKNLARYFNAVKEKASVQAALKEEGLN